MLAPPFVLIALDPHAGGLSSRVRSGKGRTFIRRVSNRLRQVAGLTAFAFALQAAAPLEARPVHVLTIGQGVDANGQVKPVSDVTLTSTPSARPVTTATTAADGPTRIEMDEGVSGALHATRYGRFSVDWPNFTLNPTDQVIVTSHPKQVDGGYAMTTMNDFLTEAVGKADQFFASPTGRTVFERRTELGPVSEAEDSNALEKGLASYRRNEIGEAIPFFGEHVKRNPRDPNGHA